MVKPEQYLTQIDKDGWELDDGEEINRDTPSTFWIPPSEQRNNLLPGQIVKLIFRIKTINENKVKEFHVERMWVIVQERLDNVYRGILDNDPYCTDDIRAGLQVYFEPRHVINIHEE